MQRWGEMLGIDHRHEVAFDETLRVAQLARPMTKIILQVGERANTARCFDKNSPGNGRKMHGEKPSPADDEQCTEQREDDEQQVDRKNSVCGQTG